MRVHHVIAATVVSLWLVAAPAPARAALFSISVDTSGLVGSGEFHLNFQLIDGDGAVGTLITLSDFDFGGGNHIDDPAPSLLGGSAGSLSTQVTLEDTSFFSSFTQRFLPGSTLAFLLEVTGASASPFDWFTMALLDAAGNEIPTLGPVEEVLSLAVFGGAMPESFGVDPARTTLRLPAPTVVAVASVPEPGTGLLLLCGALFVRQGIRRGRERDARQAGLRLP